MIVYQWLVIIGLLFGDVLSLKDVILTITPQIVERTHQATLKCTYDLEGANLYYVKWYRGMYEFFRYTPSENPTTKVFTTISGINVDVNHSNSTQVVLINIDFQLSGKFSCEVTTAEEPVKTKTALQSMLVVQLPEFPPTISVGRELLDYGDTLRANCSSSPARPPAHLIFLLNNITVAFTKPLSPRKSLELDWSDLSLELQLSDLHFTNGKLILQCVAQVPGIYHDEAILEVGSARNPVPEKVQAPNSGRKNSLSTPITMMMMLMMVFIFFSLTDY